jgi:hypothetical protein
VNTHPLSFSFLWTKGNDLESKAGEEPPRLARLEALLQHLLGLLALRPLKTPSVARTGLGSVTSTLGQLNVPVRLGDKLLLLDYRKKISQLKCNVPLYPLKVCGGFIVG